MKSINKSFLETLLEDLELLDNKKSVPMDESQEDDAISYEDNDFVEAQSLESEGYDRVYHFDSEGPVGGRFGENAEVQEEFKENIVAKRGKDEKNDLFDDFSVEKAIIYSEIIKPKYF